MFFVRKIPVCREPLPGEKFFRQYGNLAGARRERRGRNWSLGSVLLDGKLFFVQQNLFSDTVSVVTSDIFSPQRHREHREKRLCVRFVAEGKLFSDIWPFEGDAIGLLRCRWM